jgi:ketosteroid isomerase-like protein
VFLKTRLCVCKTSWPVGSEGERTGATVGRAGGPSGLDPAGAGAVARGFAQSMLARNASAAASYFSRAARILTPDGTEVRGRPEIAVVLGQVTDAADELEIRVGQTVVAGEVALCTQFWRRRALGRKTGDFDSQTTARLVLALREEGWRIMIAAPWE